MGIAYRCDQQVGLTLTVWHGTVSCDEWRDQVASLVSDPGWRSRPRFLTDLRTAGDVSTITDDHVAEMADLFAASARATVHAKVALVAADLFDGARMFEHETDSSGVRTIVFNDVGTACRWLGVEPISVLPSITTLRQHINASTADRPNDRES